MSEDRSEFVTQLLTRVREGQTSASAELLPVVYHELRALAANFFRNRPGGGTIQPTVLVHEAYLRLARPGGNDWESRAHFLAVAAKAMRQILTDHARHKQAIKRGGNREKISLGAVFTPARRNQLDLIALDDALTRLAQVDPQQAQVVELRFIAGLDVEEAAHVMGLSSRTVEREWRAARAWLRRELGEGAAS